MIFFHKLYIQTITADVDLKKGTIFSHVHFKEPKQSRQDVTFHIDKIKGRLNLAVMTRERMVIVKLDGWPEVKVRVVNAGQVSFETERPWCDIAKELGISAIRGAQISIRLDQDFCGDMSQIPAFLPFVRKTAPPPPKREPVANGDVHYSKLNVHVMHASQLGTITSPSKLTTATRTRNFLLNRPHVIVEVDEPGQRVRTDPATIEASNLDSPTWNQEFNL